jgi:hypothetical protein
LGTSNESISRFEGEEVVVAQSESDAWAMFCDKLGTWPSRRQAKPVIKKLSQIPQQQVAAMAVAHEDSDAPIPTIKLTAKSTKNRKL